MRSLVQAGVVVFALLAVCGCAGDEDEPAGVYGETCDVTHPCIEGLQCSLGLCTTNCTNNAMCSSLGTGDVCMGGSCYTGCRDTINCPDGLTCTMVGTTMGTCRP